MTEQPEALRLADMIERYNAGVMSQAICEDYCEAAAELRRLHALNQELLAQLQNMVTCFERFEDTHTALVMDDARAAIEAAHGITGETK